MGVLREEMTGGFIAVVMALSTALSPTAITAQAVSGAPDDVQIAAPYKNGDRVEKSQVRDALNYYDIVFFSGDNIGGVESLARVLRSVYGISAVALTGWEVSECTIIFNRDTINNPSASATFEQFEIDAGFAERYARMLAGVENARAVNGRCVLDHPPDPNASQ